MSHGNALVKDVALALPHALIFGHIFEVFENATLELIDLLEALFEQPRRKLLASNPTGAERGDSFMLGRIEMVLDKRRQLLEGARAGIDGPWKCS